MIDYLYYLRNHPMTQLLWSVKAGAFMQVQKPARSPNEEWDEGKAFTVPGNPRSSTAVVGRTFQVCAPKFTLPLLIMLPGPN